MSPENTIDNLFAKSLESFEAAPPPHLWRGVEESLEHQNLDNFFKEKLRNVEDIPGAHVWHSVRQNLPLSPFIRQHLHLLSGMAGALLLGMLTFHVSDMVEQSNYTPVSQQLAQEGPTKIFKLNKEAYNGSELDASIHLKWNKELETIFAAHNQSVQDKIEQVRAKYEGTAESMFNEFIASAGILPDGSMLTWDKSAKVGEKVFASISAEDLQAINALIDKNYFGKQNVLFFMPIVGPEEKKGTIFETVSPTVQPGVVLKKEENGVSVVGFGQYHSNSINNSVVSSQYPASQGSPATGGGGGVNILYPLTNKIALGSGFEIMNVSQDFKLSANNTAMLSATYLQIPLTVNYKFLDFNKGGSFVFNAGAFAGFRTAQKNTSTSNDQTLVNAMPEKELGITFGLEYQKYFNKNIGLQIGLRSTYGSDINSFDKFFSKDGSNRFTNGLRAGVIYRFDNK